MSIERSSDHDAGLLQEVRRLFDEAASLPANRRLAWLEKSGADQKAIAEALALFDLAERNPEHIRDRVSRMFALAKEAELDAGDQLGPWRLLSQLGTGGMGAVFLAERADGMYQRKVAIKLLSAVSSREQALRLQSERQLLAGLQIPGIARLYDGGTTPSGQPYLVMELVEGVPLDEFCSTHDLSLHDRIELFLKICRAVDAAHQQMVVHCDLKPSNVLVDAKASPVLLDFGIAKVLNQAERGGESLMLTPAYGAPELVEGAVISSAADVFSLGVILWNLLTGKPSNRTLETMNKALPLPSESSPLGLQWQKALRGDLDAITAKACAVDLKERYPTVAALMADIRNWQGHRPVNARDGDWLYLTRRLLRRHWDVAALSTAAVVATLVFVGGLMDARNTAEREARSAREISDYMIAMFDGVDPRQRGVDAEKPLTARELLDRASQRVQQDLGNSPLQRARMQAALGMAYQNLGVGDDAGRLLQSAAIALAQPGLDLPAERARVLAALSLEKTIGGDGASGARQAQQGLDALGKEGDAGGRARLAYAMGVALVALQKFPEGERWLKDANQLLRAIPAEGQGKLRSDIQSQFALLYWRWGRLALAEQYYRELLAITPTSEVVLIHDLETRLGQVLREAGKFAEAQALLEKGLPRSRTLYGSQSRFVLLQHEALADLYMDMGEYPAAEQQFREQLRLVRLLEGPESVRESMVLHNFAWLQAARGNAALAEEMFRQAWLIRSRHLGRESTITLRAESGLARFLIDQGRLAEGRAHLVHVSMGLATQLASDAPALLEIALGQVQLDILDGRLDVAQAWLSLHKNDSWTPRERLILMDLERQIAVKRGDRAAIERISRAGLSWAMKELGTAGAETARWRLYHAQALQMIGRPHEASLALASAAPILRKQLSASAPELKQAVALSARLPIH